MKRLAIFAGLALLALGLGVSSAADLPLAGDLDPSFGSGGVVSHSLGSSEYPDLRGLVVQPDGKIVVAGGSIPGDHGLLLARYLPDGSPDPSFGDGGYVETHSKYWAFAAAVALQPDGKLVVTGSSYQGDESVLSEFTLARYNPNGSLDASFGSGGITNTPIPEPGAYRDASAEELAVLPGGKILVAGTSYEHTAAGYLLRSLLARYTSDGSLDPTFGDGGIVQTSGGESADVAVQPDGKIIATGPGPRIALVRYDTDGSLDPTFGTGGAAATVHKRGQVAAVTFERGKIILAGDTRVKRSTYALVLARFTAGGRPDPTFGKHGVAEIKRVVGASSVLVQNDGKILIAAQSRASAGAFTDIARVLPNGRLDPHFGNRGIVTVRAALGTLALQADQKVLADGCSHCQPGDTGDTWTLDRLIGGDNCIVPGLRRKTVPKATAMLKNSYCSLGPVSKRSSRSVTRGRVVSTAPQRGTRLPDGGRVNLVVSSGKRR
jgi:uncharacterized delta-60 repeat protein